LWRSRFLRLSPLSPELGFAFAWLCGFTLRFGLVHLCGSRSAWVRRQHRTK
jgi:hypothetical protein